MDSLHENIKFWNDTMNKSLNANTDTKYDMCAQSVIAIANILMDSNHNSHHINVLRDVWDSRDLKLKIQEIAKLKHRLELTEERY